MDATAVRAIFALEFGGDAAANLRVRREHGGCSDSACFHVDMAHESFFVKVSDNHDACESEAAGLRALADTKSIRVPQVHRVGRYGNTAYLIMEYLTMSRGKNNYAALGSELGKLHKNSPGSDTAFGFFTDNYLGATRQKNMPRETEWVLFFKRNRLQFQLDLLTSSGICRDQSFLRRVQHVIDRIEELFDPKESVRASLLHGDLWQGNWGFTSDRQPVIYDPACYYGHNEAELAMMTLFGSLPDTFYASYEAQMPRSSRFDDRVPLYQLYHALNHYNMFGGGYKSLCDELLSQLETTLAHTEDKTAHAA